MSLLPMSSSSFGTSSSSMCQVEGGVLSSRLIRCIYNLPIKKILACLYSILANSTKPYSQLFLGQLKIVRLSEMGVGDVRNDQGYHTNMKQSHRQIDVAHNQIIHNRNIPMGNKNVLLLHLCGQNSSKKFS